MDILDADEQVYQRQQRNYQLNLRKEQEMGFSNDEENSKSKQKQIRSKILKKPQIIIGELFPTKIKEKQRQLIKNNHSNKRSPSKFPKTNKTKNVNKSHSPRCVGSKKVKQKTPVESPLQFSFAVVNLASKSPKVVSKEPLTFRNKSNEFLHIDECDQITILKFQNVELGAF